jgi:glycerate-2-kinase
MSFTSDGHDNTEAAGAIGDFLTLKNAEKLDINPRYFLEQNKSFDFFDKTGDLIYAKKRCFNVADLMIILKA